MQRVTMQEFEKAIAKLSETARLEPVTITAAGRDELILLSVHQLERMLGSYRRVGLAEDLPDDVLEHIERSEMAPRHKHLDAELEGWKP